MYGWKKKDLGMIATRGKCAGSKLGRLRDVLVGLDARSRTEKWQQDVGTAMKQVNHLRARD